MLMQLKRILNVTETKKLPMTKYIGAEEDNANQSVLLTLLRQYKDVLDEC